MPTRLNEFERAGLYYEAIIEAEEHTRQRLKYLWKIYLMKELVLFKHYSISQKHELVIKQTDKENKFLEHIHKNKYIQLAKYYYRYIVPHKLFASTDVNPENEEIRCLMYLLYEIFWQDHYHMNVLIKDGDTVVDIGANIGIFAIATRLLFPASKVVGFEPASKTFRTLKKNISPYSGIELHNVALGAEDTTKQLRITAKNIANRIDGDVDSDLKAEAIAKENIKMVKLDNYKDMTADVIKLDIEGYEELALVGAKELLNKRRPLIICVNEHSKRQKENIIRRMKNIAPFYKYIALNDTILCFYDINKHKTRISKLKAINGNK